LIGCDHGDNPLEVVTGKTLGSENLPDFFAFAVRHQRDVFSLDAENAFVIIALGLGAAVVRCRHGKAVGEEIGESENQHHRYRNVGTGDPRDDRECRYRAVHSAINPVAQVIAMGPAR
jgi:hypothetical protein